MAAFWQDWSLVVIVALVGTFCFGLGLVAARESRNPKDPLWIEQLPPSELPASVATTSASATTEPASSATSLPVPEPAAQPAAAAAAVAGAKHYVASKTGTKYYLPSCGTAKRIKEENRIWFATKAQAEAAGYEPSSTCKGL